MSELALVAARHRPIRPDPEDVRTEQLHTRRQLRGIRAASSKRPSWLVLLIPWIRDQPKYGDCAGESMAGGVDGVMRSPPWCSGVDLWRGARVRDGYPIGDLEEGTTLASIAAELTNRGWGQYQNGEEQDDQHAGRIDTTESDIWAADHRLTIHRRIEPGHYEGLVEGLLTERSAIQFGSGLDPAYMQFVGDQTGTSLPVAIPDDWIAGDENGHAQRYAGYWDNPPDTEYPGTPWLLVQNSWSIAWGGCRLPDGRWQRGCIWQRASGLRNVWDIHMAVLP